jgi:glutathione S-transferase
MIELIQFPWSPFCIVQRRILEFSGVPFKIVNIPSTDRTLVWRLSRQRYYAVPIVKDGKSIVFETSENSQVIAKYLDNKLGLGLFPPGWSGIQKILWYYIEDEIEGRTFRLNDIYYEERVPVAERLPFIRHKERKFGRGCLQEWRAQQKQLVSELTEHLLPFEQMLVDKPFLLENRPRFVDFNLFGMLANFLYSGHYKVPSAHARLKKWYQRMESAEFSSCT